MDWADTMALIDIFMGIVSRRIRIWPITVIIMQQHFPRNSMACELRCTNDEQERSNWIWIYFLDWTTDTDWNMVLAFIRKYQVDIGDTKWPKWKCFPFSAEEFHHSDISQSVTHRPKSKNSSLNALTLLAFLFFINVLQNCLKEQMVALNPTVSFCFELKSICRS